MCHKAECATGFFLSSQGKEESMDTHEGSGGSGFKDYTVGLITAGPVLHTWDMDFQDRCQCKRDLSPPGRSIITLKHDELSETHYSEAL